MRAFDRRQFTMGGMAALAATPLSGMRAWVADRRVRVTQAVTALSYVQSYVAREKGFFREEGLDAELVDTGGGGPDVQLVLAGRAELTVNDGAQVLPALQQGQQLRCVLSLLNRSIVNATIHKDAAARLGITAKTDFREKLLKMKGLRIGVTRPGALTWQQARFNLVSAGLNPDRDAELVGVGGAPALAAALEFGKVDVIYIALPVGERLVQDGKALTFINNASGEDPALPNFMMEGLWATPAFIAANRPLIAAAVRAYVKASHFVATADAREVLSAVKPALGSLGDEALMDGINRLKPAVSATGKIDQMELETTQKVLRMNGIINKSFTLEDVFDPSFIT